MSANIEMLEVSGLREALKEINKIDKALRREITKDFERAASPMVDAMRADVPAQPPLSGFANRSRTQWKKNESKSIRVKIDTRRPRGRSMPNGGKGEPVGVVKIRAMSAGMSIFDMAGKSTGKTPRGEALIANLQQRYGSPSRVMWPNAEKHSEEVSANIEVTVKKVQTEITRILKDN
jgi:hypothetical protein